MVSVTEGGFDPPTYGLHLKGGYGPIAIPLCYSVWHLSSVETLHSIFMATICHSEKLSTRVLEQKKRVHFFSVCCAVPHACQRSSRSITHSNRSQAVLTTLVPLLGSGYTRFATTFVLSFVFSRLCWPLFSPCSEPSLLTRRDCTLAGPAAGTLSQVLCFYHPPPPSKMPVHSGPSPDPPLFSDAWGFPTRRCGHRPSCRPTGPSWPPRAHRRGLRPCGAPAAAGALRA